MEPISVIVGAAAVTGLASFCGWLVKDYIADLKKQRDDANARTDTAIAAGHENAATVEKLIATLERRNRAERTA